MLVALCRRTLGDEILAEDAAQEAALGAMLNLDQLRRPESFGVWLAGIGLNICRRWLQHRAEVLWSLEAVAAETSGPGLLVHRQDPAEQAVATDVAARVWMGFRSGSVGPSRSCTSPA
jgi:DNA-directed RNA polymerase specialized sigma24 family protein